MGVLSLVKKNGALFERKPGMVAGPLVELDMAVCGAVTGAAGLVRGRAGAGEIAGAVG